MKKIKMMLALLAALVCGGAWATLLDNAGSRYVASNLDTAFTSISAQAVVINSLTVPTSADVPANTPIIIKSIGLAYSSLDNNGNYLVLSESGDSSKASTVKVRSRKTITVSGSEQSVAWVEYFYGNGIEATAGTSIPCYMRAANDGGAKTNPETMMKVEPVSDSGVKAGTNGLIYEIKYMVKGAPSVYTGFVPSDAPAKIFQGITVADITTGGFKIGARVAGGWVNTNVRDSLATIDIADGYTTDEATYYYYIADEADGSTVNKGAKVIFTNGTGDNEGWLCAKTEQAGLITLTAGRASAITSGTISTSNTSNGYNVNKLQLINKKGEYAGDLAFTEELDVTHGGAERWGNTIVTEGKNFGVSTGTVTIEEGAEVVAKFFRVSNRNQTGDRATVNVAGKLSIKASSDTANVWSQSGNGGILSGHWKGSSTWNISGVVDCPDAYFEINYNDIGSTVNVAGGTLVAKGIYANQNHGSIVKLTEGGTISVAKQPNTATNFFTEQLGYGTYANASTTAWDDKQAIQFTDATNGTTLDGSLGGIKLSGAITGDGKAIVKGDVTIAGSLFANGNGHIEVPAGETLKLVLTAAEITSGSGTYKVRLNNSTLKLVDANGLLVDEITGTYDSDIVWSGSKALGYYDEKGVQPNAWYKYDNSYTSYGQTAITFDSNATTCGTANSPYVVGTKRGSAFTAMQLNHSADMYCSGASYGSGDWTAVAQIKLLSAYISPSTEYNVMGYGNNANGVILMCQMKDGIPAVKLRVRKSSADHAVSEYVKIPEAAMKFMSYAVVYDNTAKTMKLYVDGTEKISLPLTDTVTISGNLQYGGIHGGLGTRGGLIIEDLRIYQSPLDAIYLKAIADNLADDHYTLNLTAGEGGYFEVSTTLANTITENGGFTIGTTGLYYYMPQHDRVSASMMVNLVQNTNNQNRKILVSTGFSSNNNADQRANAWYTGSYGLKCTYDSSNIPSGGTRTSYDTAVEGVHLITFLTDKDSGTEIYLDGVKVANDTGVHWSGKTPSHHVEFGGLYNSGDWYAKDCVIYSAAVDTTGALPVAMINDETLKNSYVSLAKALAAEGDHEITILKDVVETEAVTLTKDTTLNVLGSAVCGVACDITGNFAITKTGTGSLNLRGHRPAGAVILHEGTVKSQYGDLSISTDVTGKVVSKVLGDGLWTYSIADPVATVNGVAYASYADAIAAATSGGYSLTLIDSEVTAADIVIPAEQTLTIANAENLALNATAAFGGTGNVVLEFHTPNTYESTSDLIAFMKAASTRHTFKFFGDSTTEPKTGFTLDFGQPNTTLNSHVAFVGGEHTYKWKNNNTLWGANGTYENPTLLVEANTTVNFVGHDITGWSNTNTAGILRVKKGGTLNFSKYGDGTVYFNQQIALDPGAVMNVTDDMENSGFRMVGNVNSRHIYVAASEAGESEENRTATLNINGNKFAVPTNSSQMMGVEVGANSILKIAGNVNTVDTDSQKFIKYGDGHLVVTGTMQPQFSLSAGTATLSKKPSSFGDVNGALTLNDTSATEIDVSSIKFGANGTLDLTGCTSLTSALISDAGRDASAAISNITIPDSVAVTRVYTETREEYANCSFKVANATDVSVKVRRIDGTLVSVTADGEGNGKLEDFGTEIRIREKATSFDATFVHFSDDTGNPDATNTRGTLDYQELSGANMQYDHNPTFVNYEGEGDSKVATKNTGIMMKAHPYIQYISDNWWTGTRQLTLAVVGTMPTEQKTIFIHMGDSNDGKTGLLLATGEKEDEVVVAWNNATTINEITRLSVPNASTARHVYIVTKNDDPVADTTTFTVYLDGMKWKTLEIKPLFTIIGGVQVGSDFGGRIRNANVWHAANGESGIVNAIRLYGRVITDAEIAQYSKEAEYPYHSPKGSSARTFEVGASNWVADGGAPWSNLAKDATEAVNANSALDGSSIEATLSGAAEITVNVAEAGVAYEALNVKGSGTASFVAGEGSGAIRITGVATIGNAITVKPGALDLSTAVITLAGDGAITFDYSTYDVSTTYMTTKIALTGDVEQNNDKIIFTPPTNKPYHTVEMSYDSSIKKYVLTITPNHQNGDGVAAVDANCTSFKLLDGSAETALFPNDPIVIKYGIYEGGQWAVNLEKETTVGHKVIVDYANDRGVDPAITFGSDIPAGSEIEIAEGSKIYMKSAKSDFGSTITGDGELVNNVTFYLHGTMTISCATVSGTGDFCLEANSVLKMPSSSTVRVTAYSGNQGYVKKTTAANVDTYTFVAGTQEIAPSEDDEPVVVEDIGTGIIVNPGADVIVPTTADTSKIAVKYTIPGTGTVKDLKADGLVTVAVNSTTGAIELTTTDSAKPEETAIAMSTPTVETQDKVQFTITNPIPGLFYAVSSCDTPDGDFESATGDQATSSAAKTVSIPMTFSDGKKVKYYKVSVKATK